jgi:uncharacterized membrane protein
MALSRAAALGFSAGLRTFTPQAALHPRRQTVLMAAGEIAVDKLPITPSRLEPPGLIGRLASGAFAGVVVAGRTGAAVGALAALTGSYAGARVRGLRPGFSTALAEDAVAVGIALAAVR